MPRDPLSTIPAKFLEQCAGTWAMEESRAQQLLHFFERLDINQHLQKPVLFEVNQSIAIDNTAKKSGYLMAEGGIAIIELCGTMTKYGSSWSDFPGTIQLRKSLRAAADDVSVKGVMVMIDSPGGSTAGVSDLAEEVRRVNQSKPVHAYIEDCGASAAYFVASQAGKRICNAGAIVGSIGTYMVVQDFSAAAEKAGVKVHVVRAGAMKGAGEGGTKVTDEQLAEFQRVVTQVNSLFISALQSGLKISAEQAAVLADGRVHVGANAKALGLVDAVQTFDEALADLTAIANKTPIKQTSPSARAGASSITTPQGKDAMNKIKQEDVTTEDDKEKKPVEQEEETATGEGEEEEEETTAPAPAAAKAKAAKPATIAQLKAELPNSTAEFREAAIEQGLTVSQAKAMHAMLPTQAKAPVTRPGVKPLGTGKTDTSADGNSVDKFNQLVQAQVAAGKPRHVAMQNVCRANPDLREAMVAAHNESVPRRRRA